MDEILEAVREEAKRRQAGRADRRFDLALDALSDLADELSDRVGSRRIRSDRTGLAETLVSDDGALD